uniref:Uncharacterized protein n=1 Tax=Aegilops tauschii subsp. strangulata TaxID=200361 RepID=A0A453M7U2_AEGTS
MYTICRTIIIFFSSVERRYHIFHTNPYCAITSIRNRKKCIIHVPQIVCYHLLLIGHVLSYD